MQPEAVGDDATWQRWRQEIEALGPEVTDLVLYDFVFRLSMAAIRQWPANRLNFLYGWLVSTYARDVDMRIRRMMDRQRGTLSLRKLLMEIEQNPGVVNVHRFQASYQEGLKDAAVSEFCGLVGQDIDSLPAEVVSADIRQLDLAWKHVGLEDLTNWRIAHNVQAKAPTVIPTWQQVHDCVAQIDRTYCRYAYLLLQIDRRSTLPGPVEDVEDAVARFWLGESLKPPRSLLDSLD